MQNLKLEQERKINKAFGDHTVKEQTPQQSFQKILSVDMNLERFAY